MQNHKVQRLDIAEVARLGRENDQTSTSQDFKLKPDDEKPKVDKSCNQTAGVASTSVAHLCEIPFQERVTEGSLFYVDMMCCAVLCCARAVFIKI